MSEPEKLSPTEGIKAQSNYLRGDLARELTDGNDMFGKSSVQLLKFHGTYQQDDRDARVKQAEGKSGRSYIFMVRTRVPGGKLTSDQLLGELDLCDEIGNTTLRITSRQGLQLHGVLKRNLHQAIRRINEIQLSTLAACGDVERNIMCCPAPLRADPARDQMQQMTDRLVAHLAPKTKAYHEIWLRDPSTGKDELVAGGSDGQEVEPLYGPTYLPRKFKTAVALCDDNCVDIYANDLGFLAIVEQGQIVGYNVLIGGGMGVTPSAAKTFPALAKRMAFCRPDQVLEVAAGVIKLHRDHGNRADRKVARLKYVVANHGLAWCKARVEEYCGFALPDPHPDDVRAFDDHLGWHAQGDGQFFYGLNIENGRILDNDQTRLKTALRVICREYRPNIRLTPHQSMLFCDLPEPARAGIDDILREHGVKRLDEISTVRRWSMACVAFPTCGLAVTESERVLPGIIDRLEVELARLGLARETFTLRMTGCPNGCARPYNCDVGLVGKTAGKYTIFVGGRLLGDRLNFLYKDLVPEAEIPATLVPLFAYFKQARQPGESFGDFCHRKGADDLRAWAEQHAVETASETGVGLVAR
jgi:sulfite reductase (ferredoxin)